MKKEEIKILTYHIMGVIAVVGTLVITKDPIWSFATILIVVTILFTILNKKK